MTVLYKTGDLFDYYTGGGSVIGHGVNCQGVMGAGIAKEFRRRFPEMYNHYRAFCLTGGLQPGDYFPWYHTVDGNAPQDKYVIFNLVTQEYPGPYARTEYIEASLRGVLLYCHYLKLTHLSIPRIGCGIGGLGWDDVRESIESVAAPFPNIQLTVWSLEGQKVTS